MQAAANNRLPLLDALKAGACVLIVWHHLAFYGPMSDAARPLAPWLVDWLFQYGRMAVQVFLVVSGFLTARSLAPAGTARFTAPLTHIAKRYCRLVMPYLVALAVCMLVAKVVRPLLPGDVVPESPHEWQLLTHGLLLQGLLGQESLSAGVWYVAIDFQLFAATVLLLVAARRIPLRWAPDPARTVFLLVLCIVALSLAVFNRSEAWDPTALYFFGAYGLGMLAWWGSQSPRPRRWMAGIAVLGGAALALDFRGRIAIALASALLLLWAQSGGAIRWTPPAFVQVLGRISYSVFLLHFPIMLCVGAVVYHRWPAQPVPNALGMLCAFALSLLAGALLYRSVESRAVTVPRLLVLLVVVLAIGLLLP
ncbi:MAG: acyltransferase [Pseudomonadota bacterium]